MKFSYSSLLAFSLLGAVAAAPSRLEQRLTNTAINLNHGLEEGELKECGGIEYDGDKVHQAIQRAVDLQLAGETRGKAKYPHPFNNDDSKGNKLKFPSYCPADTDRFEYPLIKDEVYDGGKHNTK